MEEDVPFVSINDNNPRAWFDLEANGLILGRMFFELYKYDKDGNEACPNAV